MNSFPVVIVVGVIVVVLLLAFVFGDGLMKKVKGMARHYEAGIERADFSMKAEEYILTLLGGGALLWLVIMFILRVTILVGLLILPICLVFTLLGGNVFLKMAGERRMESFVNQMEMLLRMMAGALRVGLGLRQSMILVAEEMPDPARREFQRIVGRTNLGISINDALDDLATSLPAPEVIMMSRAIRVQSQTGGDLAQVLETLATTIKDRRRIYRKMSALTAQGRAGAWIIGALPIVVGGFVVFTQPDLAAPLLHTTPGYLALGLVGILETAAILSLMRILQFDV